MDKNTSLAKAVSILGGVVSTASALDLKSYQVVQQWLKTRIPAEYCPALERAVNFAVTCEELRPDVYLRGTKKAA